MSDRVFWLRRQPSFPPPQLPSSSWTPPGLPPRGAIFVEDEIGVHAIGIFLHTHQAERRVALALMAAGDDGHLAVRLGRVEMNEGAERRVSADVAACQQEQIIAFEVAGRGMPAAGLVA